MIYDVIVCGGGVAGVSAALAAARKNARVLLVEREYALGGLATLGLICIYLPLCDGLGYQLSYGLSEELLKLSLKYGPGKIPSCWQDPDGSIEERAKNRYAVKFNMASFMISMEEELLNAGVKILYGCHISGVETKHDNVTSIVIETKTGPQEIYGRTFVDATGDADICYFANEETIEDRNNRRTGWYFSYDDKTLNLNSLTDSPYEPVPETSRVYSGIDMDDVSQNCIDGRKMILEDILKKKETNPDVYPLIIPSFHGLRMTRRLVTDYQFSLEDEGIFFKDSIGMIGNWRLGKERYSLRWAIIEARKNHNLYAAGRCVSADEGGQDLTRVIPSCAVTGEAAGVMAAYQAQHGMKMSVPELQEVLRKNGVVFKPELFRETK